MTMFKTALAAAVLGLFAIPAMASPLPASPVGVRADTSVQQIDYRRDRRREYRTPDRYRSWHRYSNRPHDWRRRSCVAVGPFWFCP